ncbi:hypothetical protein ACV4QK_20570 (plasmid) [Alteromonas macleodii]
MYKNILRTCDKTIGFRLAVALEMWLLAFGFLLLYVAVSAVTSSEPEMPQFSYSMFLVPALVSAIIGVIRYIKFTDEYIRVSRGLTGE